MSLLRYGLSYAWSRIIRKHEFICCDKFVCGYDGGQCDTLARKDKDMGVGDEKLAGLTLGLMLANRAASEGDRIAIHSVPNDAEISYRELDRSTNRIARGLKALGIGNGSTLAILSENRVEQIQAYFAIAKLGARSVPINTMAKGYFLERFLGNSGSMAVLLEPQFLSVVADVAHLLPDLTHIILLDNLEGGESFEIPAALARLAILRFGDLVDGDDSAIDEAEAGDLVQILYTSGTTGPSKGGMYSHTTILNWAKSVSGPGGQMLTRDDVMMVVFPLFHAGAWLTSTMTTLWRGGKVVIYRRFSASRYFADARECGATASLLVGVANFVAAQPPSPDDRAHKVRQVVCGPAPSDAVAFEKRFGVTLTSGFGLSDYGCSHYLGPTAPREKLGACGVLLPDCDARIVDERGYEVPAGQKGELLLRINTPGGGTLGYFDMPEATIESRKDLWFHTGDVGIIDEDGYLWFVDRKKDAIRRRGENISSLELEQVLSRHDAIASVAFFAVQAEHAEDEVAAAVVVKPGASIAETEIVDYCTKHMPRFAVPRFVRIMQEFPLTASGKVEKHKVKSGTQDMLDRVWDREARAIFPVRSDQ